MGHHFRILIGASSDLSHFPPSFCQSCSFSPYPAPLPPLTALIPYHITSSTYPRHKYFNPPSLSKSGRPSIGDILPLLSRASHNYWTNQSRINPIKQKGGEEGGCGHLAGRVSLPEKVLDSGRFSVRSLAMPSDSVVWSTNDGHPVPTITSDKPYIPSAAANSFQIRNRGESRRSNP